MRRYEGTGLPANPRVAVVANDAIGNFVVATPLLKLLRRQLKPSMITFFGGKRTWELQVASSLFEATYPLHGTPLSEAIAAVGSNGRFDLIVNVENGNHAKAFVGAIAGDALVCGPCSVDGVDAPYPVDARGDLWRDKEWIAPDLTKRYPFLLTGWISEIYVRLAYLTGKVPMYAVPSQPVQHDYDVLVATSASLPEKLWPLEKWLAVLGSLAQRGLKVGLLGAKPKEQGEHWKGADAESEMVASGSLVDLRGKWSLPEVVGALATAKAVFTLDNGILHLAAAADTPTVGLFRHGIHRLWAPPSPKLIALTAEPDQPVEGIPVRAALEALARVV